MAHDRVAALERQPDERTFEAYYDRRLTALQRFVRQICRRFNVDTDKLQHIYLRGVQERWPRAEK
jgi:hypothetical protein